MEADVVRKTRIFRSQEAILNILDAYKKSGLSIKSFCTENNLAQASFHNWIRKFKKRRDKAASQPGFAKLQITAPAIASTPLFAEVKEIKIYQWVTAAYLKELLQ